MNEIQSVAALIVLSAIIGGIAVAMVTTEHYNRKIKAMESLTPIYDGMRKDIEKTLHQLELGFDKARELVYTEDVVRRIIPESERIHLSAEEQMELHYQDVRALLESDHPQR